MLIKFLTFLFSAAKDKEGMARASASTMASVVACWVVFTPLATFTAFKVGQDYQNRLIWAEIAQIKNTVAQHGIYVPEIVLNPTQELKSEEKSNEHQTP